MNADGLGHQLEARRRVMGLTQETLAELSGVSARTIYAIESGKPTARLDSILAIAQALGLELDLRVRGQ